MIAKVSNRTGAEAVFIGIRNVTGAAVSAGVPVEWECSATTDGNGVTSAKSSTNSLSGLFAGITDAALADSAYGLIQVYGFRTSAYVSGHTGTTSAPGTFLKPVGAQLQTQTMSAATTSGHIFVSLAESVSTSQLANRNILIRAM